jgi:hypothetical protein
MMSRPSSMRWAFWLVALALLLKAAVPMLAAASAHAQGKALVQVCTVYGMATVVVDADGQPVHPPEQAGAHGGEHCVLSGLVALGVPPSAKAVDAVPPLSTAALRVASTWFQTADASAAWIARLKHGPPNLS